MGSISKKYNTKIIYDICLYALKNILILEPETNLRWHNCHTEFDLASTFGFRNKFGMTKCYKHPLKNDFVGGGGAPKALTIIVLLLSVISPFMITWSLFIPSSSKLPISLNFERSNL